MAWRNTLTGERVNAWMRAHEPAVDILAALALLAATELDGVFTRTDTVSTLLTFALVAPLAVRRRWPVTCLILVLSAGLVQWLATRSVDALLLADVAVPLAIGSAAGYAPPLASRIGLAAGLVGAVLGGLSWPLLSSSPSSHFQMAAFLASTVVAAWTIGALNRARRRRIDALAERARLLEVERDQRDRLLVLAERNRIAREMHDVVAHSLAVIITQADGGRYAGSHPAATGALETISAQGRQALAETRRVLGILREDTPTRQPGAQDIPELLDKVRAGGLDVRSTVELPPDVELGLSLVVYRIVQEGLTNVLKHARTATRADVTVRWGNRKLWVEILDNGRGPATRTGSGGYGMIGMRERVSAYGGTVTLRPYPGGGHLLSALIPVAS